MKSHNALGLIVAIGLACSFVPAVAETDSAAASTTAAHPWENAQAVLDATDADVAKGGGFQALRPHLAELEEALAGADAAFAATDSGTGPIYVLTDGPTDTLFSLVAAAAAQDKTPGTKGRETIAVKNPYPAIALYIGSYDNEIGRFEDALRALDKGLALYATHGIEFGLHQPSLVSERGVALARLNRLPEALAAYEDGLKLAGIDDHGRARMHRGRGFVLTEMERLDEAEAAYRESLKFEPGNKIAIGELDYITRLRLGGAKAPSGITAPGAAPQTQ